MNAPELRRRHFPVFEWRAVDPFVQAADHQREVELFLLGKTRDIDRIKARNRLARMFKIIGNRLVRKIAEPVVIAIISDLRGQFGLRAQCVLSLLGKQPVEFRAPRIQCRSSGLCKQRDNESHDKRNNHERYAQDQDKNLRSILLSIFVEGYAVKK